MEKKTNGKEKGETMKRILSVATVLVCLSGIAAAQSSGGSSGGASGGAAGGSVGGAPGSGVGAPGTSPPPGTVAPTPSPSLAPPLPSDNSTVGRAPGTNPSNSQ